MIDCKKIANQIIRKLKARRKKFLFEPELTIVVCRFSPEIEIFVKNKINLAKELSINTRILKLPEKVTSKTLTTKILELNSSSTNGIIVQLPLPKGLDTKPLQYIAPEKDIDGFSLANQGKLSYGEELLASPTAKAAVKVLESIDFNFEGANCCVISHSILIGRPLAQMLLNRNATVSVCHAYTKDLAKYTRKADVVFSASGVPSLIKGNMLRKGVVLVDIGTKLVNGKLVGDISEKAQRKASFFTSVPGGVGLITVPLIFENLMNALELQFGEEYA
ncbi:MAG: bifunctional 5,10-methylenetetrahydrofolate dehydrogenase/5,10-methenyltetrahydrofolate cyclohydrolase [Candidatus Diapherotrites archaeon]|nr:bifunctional 5,10-methylenetetrahydrofolate dehydrogenase/5,10-methenyltetrahydrofolate cyclohydrolase [Candidatus Diapherotrites archaeon]